MVPQSIAQTAAPSPSLILLLIGLAILVGLATLVGLSLYAVLKNRPGIIVGIGVLLAALIGGGAILSFAAWLTFRGLASEQRVRHRIEWRQEVEKARLLARAKTEQRQLATAQSDIQPLMDEVDAPRIQLPPTSSDPAKLVDETETISEVSGGPAGKPDTEPTDAVAAEDDKVGEDAEAVVASESPESDKKDRESTDGEHAPADEHVAEAAEEPAATTAAEAETVTPAAEAPLAEAAPPTEETKSESAPKPNETTAPRPAWVDAPPQRVGKSVREVIATDEYATTEECWRATDIYLLLKTYNHLQELVGRPVFESELPSISFGHDTVMGNGSILYQGENQRWHEPRQYRWYDHRLQYLQRLGIGVDYVRREIVAKDANGAVRQYFETNTRSVGPMHRLYTQVEFTPGVDRDLRKCWESYERKERLAVTGIGAGGILGLLGLVYGLLKVDTWTKGYYTKRLFLGVPAAIFGLAVLIALLS